MDVIFGGGVLVKLVDVLMVSYSCFRGSGNGVVVDGRAPCPVSSMHIGCADSGEMSLVKSLPPGSSCDCTVRCADCRSSVSVGCASGGRGACSEDTIPCTTSCSGRQCAFSVEWGLPARPVIQYLCDTPVGVWCCF